MKQFGSGLSSRGSLVALAASCEKAGIGGRAAGRCMLVSGLPWVLKGIANNKDSEWSVAFAEAAAATSCHKLHKRFHQDGVAVQRFLGRAVVLNHLQHEAVVRGPSEG